MSRNRYQAILGMLHESDQITEDTNAKLKKVDEFVDNFCVKYKGLFQPYRNVPTDELLVKSQHWPGVKHYIVNKAAKSGLELRVIANRATGCTYDFYVYAGETNGV